ncbi:MAG: hypothetical protein WC917_00820 [Bacilli bacterium]|jgi:hypothetical protein
MNKFYKTQNGKLIEIDKHTGKDNLVGEFRSEDKNIKASNMAKSLNMAEKMGRVNEKGKKEMEKYKPIISDSYLMDKYKSKFV